MRVGAMRVGAGRVGHNSVQLLSSTHLAAATPVAGGHWWLLAAATGVVAGVDADVRLGTHWTEGWSGVRVRRCQ